MVKHTQIIRRQQPRYCLSVFGHFERFALKGLKIVKQYLVPNNHNGMIIQHFVEIKIASHLTWENNIWKP